MTLCRAFQQTVERVPDRIALRTLDGATELTYAQFGARVRRVAAGLHAFGLRPGDTLALRMANCVEFHLLDVAAMHLGAIPFSIYGTASPEQVAYMVDHAGARIAAGDGPSLEPLRQAGVERVIDVGAIDELEAAGDAAADFDFDAAWQAVTPDHVLTLIYTSGTTGPPKGVEITHASELACAEGFHDMYDFPEGAEVVSYLPMAHIAERNCSHYWAQIRGFTVTIVPDPAQVAAALTEVRPSWFFAVPRIFEKLRAAVEADADAATREAIARGVARLSDPAAPEPDDTLLEPIRRRLGLDRVRAMLIGGTKVAEDLVRFYRGIGLPLYEIWAMSETTGVGTGNRPGRERIGTVGAAAVGVELRIAEDGEIQVRGDCLFRGYRNQPEATAATHTPDGWLSTGDLGSLDADGFLTVSGRKKELIINSSGKNMSPTNIEAAIKEACPLVGSAVAIGDGRPYNVALLLLDPDAAAAFARAHDLDASDLAALAADPVVLEAVATGVAAGNERLSRVEQIKRFEVLPGEWLPGGDELTPTAKLRRGPINDKYGDTIDALYARSTTRAGGAT